MTTKKNASTRDQSGSKNPSTHSLETPVPTTNGDHKDSNAETVTAPANVAPAVPEDAQSTFAREKREFDNAPKASETESTAVTKRFRAALDELMAAGRAYRLENPGRSSFVGDKGFKVEFGGAELVSFHR